MTSTDFIMSQVPAGKPSVDFVQRDGTKHRGPEAGSELLVPIAVVLTFVGVVNSLQAYFIFPGGEHSLVNFTRLLISNLFYSLYFIVPALTVRALSGRVHLRRESLASWISIHLGTLLFLTVVHQVSSLMVDRFVLGSRQTETVFSVLLNNPGVWGDLVVYVLLLLGFYMIEYRKRIQENEMKYSLLEMELVKARLQELRGRIHPQFLFNTLSEARNLVGRGSDREANKIISLLSDFLRVTVYGGENEETELNDEVNFLNNYLAIEEIRFGRRLEVAERISRDVKRAVVPNFILQPLTEEVITEKLERPGTHCKIEVAAAKVGDRLEMTIRGKGKGSPREPAAGAMEDVFEITRKRLAQLYPDEYEFNVENSQEGTETVKLRIPVRYATGMHALQKEKTS